MLPSGVHVDPENTAWVMDQLASTDDGSGVLYSIGSTAGIQEVLGGLKMGSPGGVSLAPGGMEAVIPSRGSGTGTGLRTVNLTTGNQAFLPTPQVGLPGGIRTARHGSVMILIDNGGSAIYRVE